MDSYSKKLIRLRERLKIARSSRDACSFNGEIEGAKKHGADVSDIKSQIQDLIEKQYEIESARSLNRPTNEIENEIILLRKHLARARDEYEKTRESDVQVFQMWHAQILDAEQRIHDLTERLKRRRDAENNDKN